jgi:YHS domain-containing protein
MNNMKTIQTIIVTTASAFTLLASPALRAAEPPKAAAETAKAATAKPYPLDTCIVSDEKLGKMGKPVSFVYQGQEIKLCCKSCRKDFDKEPAKYLKKLTDKK